MISADVRRQVGRLPAAEAVDAPKVAELIGELRRLVVEHDRAQRDEEQLRAAHHAAEKADREALADAMRAGEADPGSRSVEKAAKRLADARRRREALGRAAEKSYGELAEVVREHRAAWLAGLVDRQARERRVFAEKLDELEAAYSALAGSVGLERWVAGFPEAKLAPAAMTVDGLRSPNGDDYPAAAVFAGFRGFLADREPERQAELDRSADADRDVEPAVVAAVVPGGLFVAPEEG